MVGNKNAIDGDINGPRGLKRKQVGTWGGIAEEIAAMAPGCDAIAFVTSAAVFAFFLTPLSFMLATLTMFLEVNTLYHLSKRHASAGGYYGYIANAFGPVPAVSSGLLYVMYQIVSTAAIPVFVAGVVLPGVVRYFIGINLPAWIWIPFILVFIIIPIMIAMFGIRPQIKYIRIAAFFEVFFLMVLFGIIILEAHDNTINVFNPFVWPQYNSWFTADGGTIAGVGLGMIFGLTSFIGYGGSAPLGEEAVNGRAITKSLVFGLLIVGIVLTEVAYAQIVGWGIPLMQSFSTSGIPGIIIATVYTGAVGGIMFSLVAFNSAFSDSVAMQSNAGRVYYAMARDGIIPEFFAYLHKKWATPTNSLKFIAIVSSILAIAGTFIISYGAGVTPYTMLFSSSSNPKVINALEDSFEFLTTMALVGLIITHILLNTSVITMFRRLKEKHTGLKRIIHPIIHYVLPVIATIIFMFVLYESVISPVYPITDAVALIAAYVIFTLVYSFRMQKLKPGVMEKAGKIVNIIEEEKLELEKKNEIEKNVR